MSNFNHSVFSDENFWKRLGVILCLASCFTFFGCTNLLPAPQLSPSAGITNSNNKTIAAPLNVIASNGQKRQITLSWTSVPTAKYYYIYRADSPYSEFVQIDVAQAGETTKALSVPAGYSGYFKVAAVSGLGELSELSLTSYGTSLATPIITDIQEGEDSTEAKVFWYMENLSEKSYYSAINFIVYCYNEDGSEKDHKLINSADFKNSNGDTSWTFTNLNTATNYLYEIEAYTTNQTDIETSARVNKLTAVSTVPQVAAFTASEGTEKELKVAITITLPQMAKTLANAGNGGSSLSDYEDKPLYFVIQRFDEKVQDFVPCCNYLSFNGQTTPLSAGDPIFDTYTEGNTVTWYDTNVVRGIKYQYRVLSYVDNHFESDGTTRKHVTHPADKANKCTGWVCNEPAISSSAVNYEKNADDNSIIESASVELNANWSGLGKEENYKYLVTERHYKIKNDNNDTEDNTGTLKFIKASAEKTYFDSVDQIKDLKRNFTFDTSDINADANKEIRGYYLYSIYVIPVLDADANPSPDESILDHALVYATDKNRRLVINEDVQSPVLTVQGGYKNKALISYNKVPGATYTLVRQTVDNDGKVIVGKDVTTDITENENYTDTTVEPGMAYQYTVYSSSKALTDVPSSTIRCYTLGKPELLFDTESLDYTTVTVAWNSAMHPLETAEISATPDLDKHVTYSIIVNGNTFDLSEHINDYNKKRDEKNKKDYTDAEENYLFSIINGTEFVFTLKKKIPNFDYSGKTPKIATDVAGKNFDITLSVSNDITKEETDNHNDITVQAHTLGPAILAGADCITATKASAIDNIVVEWKKVEGAKYYAIRRTCSGISSDEEAKHDVIFVAADGTVTVNEETVDSNRTVVASLPNSFKLTDTQCKATDTTSSFQTNQEKIAWGLEFEYTIIPVLSTADNPFEEENVVTIADMITYLNESKVTQKGYTPGYGMNVTASKADSPDSVTVTWTKPNDYENSQPRVWCRKENTTEWIGGTSYSADTVSASIYLPDNLRTDKVEFAVSYDTNSNPKMEESYLTNLASKKDENKEAQNIGYQFTLSTFYATKQVTTAEVYSEKINWTKDQQGERKRGAGDNIEGDCYEIQIMNKNCSNKWYTIATMDKAGNLHIIDKENNPNWKDWFDVSLVNNGNNSMTITPGSVSDAGGVHDGLLKVQRDYKHYYRLVAKRKATKDGPEIEAVLGGIDTDTNDAVAKEPVYGVRKISNDEFTKCVTLILADAVHQKGGEGGTLDGASGKLTTGYEYRADTNYNFTYQFENYKNQFYKLPGSNNKLESSFVLNSSKSSDGRAYNKTNYAFGENTINVTFGEQLPSYQGYIKLKCGAFNQNLVGSWTRQTRFDLSLTYKNGTTSQEGTVSVSSNETIFKQWFPYELGTQIKSENDGTAYYPYQAGTAESPNLWWEVRD